MENNNQRCRSCRYCTNYEVNRVNKLDWRCQLTGDACGDDKCKSYKEEYYENGGNKR